MRRSSLRLYGPFLAVVLVQALLVTVAPSRAPDRDTSLATGGGSGRAGSSATGPGGTDAATGATVGSTGGTAGGGGATGGQQIDPATGQPIGSGSGAVAGDTSHCVGDRQFDVLLDNPPCMPRFVGDNGGATYPGVTADTVKVIILETSSNAAVNAVLSPQGLAATAEERQAMYDATIEFFNSHMELYGRRIEITRIQAGDDECNGTPPTPAECKEFARQIIAMQPFMVVFGTPLYDEVFDEFSRAGIISVGGWHFDDQYFTAEGRRGLRYDLFMDGTRSAEMIASYYCTKMAGGTATRAGLSIHPSIGGRNTRRRLGISVPEIPANIRTAEHLRDLVMQCDPTAPEPIIRPYVSDIDRAAEQTTATTLAYINAHVTTVVCMCDPIAPAFQTKGFTQQGYFPEYLMPGLGLLDYDKLGRLYDPQQMAHAFGPGHLAEPIPFDQTDAVRVWRATGRPGQPCPSCNLYYGYMALVAGLVSYAGPTLDPPHVEAGILSSPPYGGDKPGTQLIEFGPGDYTALSDAREIYWCATCPSNIDGQAGAYISPNNARRYRIGDWLPGLDEIPVAPS